MGAELKSTDGWYSRNATTNDIKGFRVLPAGLRLSDGAFNDLGRAYFWSSSESGASNAWCRYFDDGSASVYRNDDYRTYGFSLRCLEN